MKCDRLDCCVNLKEFWLLFVTREKAEYFYVNEFFKGPSKDAGALLDKPKNASCRHLEYAWKCLSV